MKLLKINTMGFSRFQEFCSVYRFFFMGDTLKWLDCWSQSVEGLSMTRLPRLQGDLQRLLLVICFWHIKKFLNRISKQKIIQEFILGGFIICHSLTFGQSFCSLKQNGLFLNQQKVTNYTGCQQQKILSNIQRIFG